MTDRPIGVTSYVARPRCDRWVHDPDRVRLSVGTTCPRDATVAVVRIERLDRRFRRDRTGENA
jgi:hypothetical protein